jgi:inhibitor of cysteine peptidase
VRLPETPSTGYVWDLVDPAAGVVEVVDDRFETADDDDERIGADGVRHVWLRVVAPGSGRLRLELRRPWQADVRPVRTFEATVDALAPLTGDVTEGVTTDQKKGVIKDFQAAAA